MWELPGRILVVAVLAVMAHAAYRDVRDRRVPDAHWLAIGVAGVVLGSAQRWDEAGAAVTSCFALASVLLLAYALSPRLTGWSAAVAVASACILTVAPSVAYGYWPTVSALAMYLVFWGMYQTGLLRGGADAKCLMVLALAFPTYPADQSLWTVPYPESLVMNPSLAVLILALVMTLAACLWVFARNARAGDWGIHLFTSYRMPVEEARGSFVWPVVSSEEGGRRRLRDGDGAFDGLEGEVTVTPMVPFILPLAVASLIVLVLGNPLAVLIAA